MKETVNLNYELSAEKQDLLTHWGLNMIHHCEQLNQEHFIIISMVSQNINFCSYYIATFFADYWQFSFIYSTEVLYKAGNTP